METSNLTHTTWDQVNDIFAGRIGADEIAAKQLADLSGVHLNTVYKYQNGQAGAAVALVTLGREDPEIAMQVAHMMGGTYVPRSAGEAHGNVRELLAIMAEAVAELTRMLIDGIFCHRDKARTHNLANRLMTRLALWRVANS